MKINSVKLKLVSLLSLTTMLFPTLTLAQSYPYSVNVRAIFLTGCLLDDKSNIENDQKAYSAMKTCVCILDKFQARYTNQQFTILFDNANKEAEPYKRELDNFVKQNIMDCL